MTEKPKVRILTVEDEPGQAQLVKTLLEMKLGARVDLAQSCAAAREMLSSNDYDLITLDYQLPDGDGLELLEHIVALDEAPLVVMVTGHGDEQVAADAFRIGAFSYVVKDKRLSTMLVENVEKALLTTSMQRTEQALRRQRIMMQTALDSMRDLFMVFDMDGGLVTWNESVRKLTDLSAEELLGFNPGEVRDREDREALLSLFEAVKSTGAVGPIEFDYVTRDSRRLSFEITGARIDSADGTPIGMAVIARDIRESKKMREDIQRSRERFRAVVEVQRDCICRFKPHTYEVTFVNDAFQEFFGEEDDYFLGRSLTSLLVGEDGEMSIDNITPVMDLVSKGAEDISFEWEHVTTKGVFWLLWSGSPIRDSRGDVVEIQAVGRDITALKTAQREIEIQRDLAIAALRAGSMSEVLDLCLRAAIEISGMDCGAVFLADPATGAFDLKHSQGISDEFAGQVLRVEKEHGLASLMAGRTPTYVRIHESPAGTMEAERIEGLRAGAILPVLHEGEVIACLNVASHEVDEVPMPARPALEAIVAHMGAYIAKELSEVTLQQSEEKFENLFQNAPSLMVVSDAETGEIIDANRAFLEAFGYEVEDIIGETGKGLKVIAGQYDRDWVVEKVQKEGMVKNLQIESQTSTGERRDHLISMVPVVMSGRKCLMVSGVDVTEYERARRASDERSRKLVESSSDILTVIGEEGLIRFANPSIEGFIAYSPDDLEGTDVFELVHPDERAVVRTAFQSLWKDPDLVYRGSFRVRHRDGSWKEIEGIASALIDSDGVVGILINGRDVTDVGDRDEVAVAVAERARALARLWSELAGARLDHEAALSTMASYLARGIGDVCVVLVESEDGQALELAALEHRDRETGERLREAVPGSALRVTEGFNFDAYRQGMSVLVPQFDWDSLPDDLKGAFEEYARSSGVKSVLVVPFKLEGKPIGTLSVMTESSGRTLDESDLADVQDLADRAAAYIEMARLHHQLRGELEVRRQRERELEVVNRELQGFAHTVSHDLKGPITTVKLSLELLSERAHLLEEGELRNALDTLTRSVGKSYDLIENLLNLAESGQVPVMLEDVDIEEIVQRVIQDYEHEIKSRGALVVTDGALGVVHASPTQMYQVFSNLIMNAVRHNGGDAPEVMLSRREMSESGAHRFLMRDNGPGISEELLPTIFEPFVKREGGGTGTGLAIVNKLVTVYGGEIKAYNEGGACFEFTLRDFEPA